MRMRNFGTACVIAIATLIAACGGRGGSSDTNKIIKSTTAGSLTITLAGASGELKSGENELMITFGDSTGNPLDVGAASLNFHMPAMGSMAEMNNKATLTTPRSRARIARRSYWSLAARGRRRSNTRGRREPARRA